MADSVFDNLVIPTDLAPVKDQWKKDFVAALNRSASELGISSQDLATALSYETGGTFDSSMRGGNTGKRVGLIQAGEDEQAQYGISAKQSPAEQMEGVTRYLKDRGLQPGMGLADIYSTINAGRPGRYNASDRPGETVDTHVQRMSDPNDYRNKAAVSLLQGEKTVPMAESDDSWAHGLEIPESLPQQQVKQHLSELAGQPFSEPGWNGYLDVANKFLLGAGRPIMAATQAGKQALAQMQNGVSPSDAIAGMADSYVQARDQYDAAQQKWAAENPRTDLVNMLAAPLIPTLAIMGATKGKAGPLLEQGLTSMSPRLGPQISKFIGGSAGAGEGLTNFLTRAGSRAVSGAVEGGLAGALQSGLSENSIGENAALGAEVGGIVSPVLGALGPSIKSLFDYAVTKPVATIAQKAVNLGIDLKAPQIVSARSPNALQRVAEEHGPEQLAQYTRAISKEFGENTDTITKDVLENAEGRIGKQFEKFANNVGNIGDVPLMRDLTRLKADAFNQFGDAKNPTYITTKAWLNQIGRAAKNGVLDGDVFRSLTRKDSAFAREFLQSNDPNKRYFGQQIYGFLQDALERNARPEDVAALKQAKQQWAAMKQIEPIAEKSWPSGVIDPQSMSRLRGSNTGNLNDLAEIGQLLPKPGKTGGVKESRNPISDFIGKVPDWLKGGVAAGGTATGLIGAYHAFPQAMAAAAANPALAAGTAIAGAGGLMANKYIQNMLMSPRFRDTLIQRGLGQDIGFGLGPNMAAAAQQQAPVVLGTELYGNGE